MAVEEPIVDEIEDGAALLIRNVDSRRGAWSVAADHLGMTLKLKDATFIYRDNWIWEKSETGTWLSYAPFAWEPEGEPFGAWLVTL